MHTTNKLVPNGTIGYVVVDSDFTLPSDRVEKYPQNSKVYSTPQSLHLGIRNTRLVKVNKFPPKAVLNNLSEGGNVLEIHREEEYVTEYITPYFSDEMPSAKIVYSVRCTFERQHTSQDDNRLFPSSYEYLKKLSPNEILSIVAQETPIGTTETSFGSVIEDCGINENGWAQSEIDEMLTSK